MRRSGRFCVTGATLFIAFATASAEAQGVASSSSIREICKQARKGAGQARNTQELASGICQLSDSFPQNAAIREKASSVLNAARAIQDDFFVADMKSNTQLRTEQTALAELITQTENHVPESASPGDPPLAQALGEFLRQWGDPKSRANPSRYKNYYEAMKAVLLKTEAGPGLVECFERVDGSAVGFGVYDLEVPGYPSVFSSYDPEMSYQLVREPSDPPKYRKALLVNRKMDPVDAVVRLAHELKHSCQAEEFFEFKLHTFAAEREYGKSLGKSDVHDKLIKYHSELGKEVRFLAVDEVRAHAQESSIFRELAQALPGAVCNRAFVGSKGQILTLAEAQANQEDWKKEGTFASRVVRVHGEHQGWLYKEVYQVDSDGNPLKGKNGEYLLHNDLLPMLNDAGFKVVQSEAPAATSAASSPSPATVPAPAKQSISERFQRLTNSLRERFRK